jgi:broad specificity phosphatase PhoE
VAELALAQVFLVRHAKTDWNRTDRRQGRLDSPLTSEGIAENHRFAAVVAGLPVDGVFSSPLGRAAATAGVLARDVNLEVVLIDKLHEIDHGEMSGLTDEEIERTHPGELARRYEDLYRWRFPGGESYADADIRAAAALQEISDQGARRPLVVSHEMVGRMVLRNLLQLEPDDALKLRHPHDVIYQVDVAVRRLTEIRPDSK